MFAFALSRGRSSPRRCSIPGIISLAVFYIQKVKLSSVVIPSLVSKDTLPAQYKLKWENQQEAALVNAKQPLKQEQNSHELLQETRNSYFYVTPKNQALHNSASHISLAGSDH